MSDSRALLMSDMTRASDDTAMVDAANRIAVYNRTKGRCTEAEPVTPAGLAAWVTNASEAVHAPLQTALGRSTWRWEATADGSTIEAVDRGTPRAVAPGALVGARNLAAPLAVVPPAALLALVTAWQNRPPLVGNDERRHQSVPTKLAWCTNVIRHRDGAQRNLPFDDAEMVQAPPAAATRFEVPAHLPYLEPRASKLPWAALDLLDFGASRGHNGPVPVETRTGWELLLMPEPGDWHAEQATITPTLGVLGTRVWPNTSYRQGTHGQQIYRAARWLNDPDNATWFRRNETSRPILVVTFFAPPMAPYHRDSTVGVHVVLPDGGRRTGPQYDAQLRRVLAATSYRQHRAYLAAVCLWDRHATVGGYLVQRTMPVVHRIAGGEYVLDPDGKIATEKDGRPSKRATHPLAVQTGKREPNPAADDAYPWLEGHDVILATHHRVDDTTRKRNEQRRLALVTLEAMRAQATRRGPKGRVIVTRGPVLDFEARYRSGGALTGAELADLPDGKRPPHAELEAIRLLPSAAHFAAYEARRKRRRKRTTRKQ